MARTPQPKAKRGSQKWIQEVVNNYPKVLDDKIKREFNLINTEEISWKSPLCTDEYAEYSDNDFLKLLNINLEKLSLPKFWPKWGPHWDALAKIGNDAVILVEAKSHIDEIDSNPTGAKDESSKLLIKSSLDKTKSKLGSTSKTDWSTCFYQYTNRLAFHSLLQQNGITSYLANVYFVNDVEMNGPKTEEEWSGAIHLLKKHLGLNTHEPTSNVADIFISVDQING